MHSPFSAEKEAISKAINGSDGEVLLVESTLVNGLLTPGTGSSASMELRGVDPPIERFRGKSRSPEKVMDKSRRFKIVDGVPGVGTDDSDSSDYMTSDFAAGIKSKAIFLRFFCYNHVTYRKNPFNGQAALLHKPENGKLFLATCKHNLVSEPNRDGQHEECWKPHSLILADGGIEADIPISNTGWECAPQVAVPLRNRISWAYGVDINLEPLHSTDVGAAYWPGEFSKAFSLNAVMGKLSSFDVVEESFVYEAGLKIGLVVYFPDGVAVENFSEVDSVEEIDVDETYATTTRGRDETNIASVLGDGDEVKLHTGHITYVGDKHIEYDANTYKGCSGAIVIVLDPQHPDLGKAIAMHAGYKPELGSNLGFKLAGCLGEGE